MKLNNKVYLLILNKARGKIFPPVRTTHIKATSTYAKGHAILLFLTMIRIKEMEININEANKDPKIIRKFEPFIWVAFIALTALVGCPVF